MSLHNSSVVLVPAAQDDELPAGKAGQAGFARSDVFARSAGKAGLARSEVFARLAGKSDAVLRTVMLALSRKVMLPASAGCRDRRPRRSGMGRHRSRLLSVGFVPITL